MQNPEFTCPTCRAPQRLSARFCSRCGAPLTALPIEDVQPQAGGLVPLIGTRDPGEPLDQQGRYRVVRLLGKGGFGEAYLAHDTRLNRSCVAKCLQALPGLAPAAAAQARERFSHEARLLISLNSPGHPNIPEIYEYLPEAPALVMKYIVGASLAELLAAGGPLAEEQALRYGRAVCDGLVYMHRRRPEPVIHRDIKPANILLDVRRHVWLIDFGLARALPAQAVSAQGGASDSAGTPGFMAPEQWAGQAQPRSDVYALAATLRVLLTYRRRSAAAPPAPALRPEVARLLAWGLAEQAVERPDARTFLAELDALLAAEAIVPPPALPPPPDPGEFVGRRAELAAHGQALATEGYLLISGLAGVGKTTLAAAIARQNTDAGRIFWHTFHEGEGVAAAIWALAGFLAWQGHAELWRLLSRARSGGVMPPGAEVLADYLAQALRGRDLLCCFDDVQFVADDPTFARLVAGLRAHSPERRCRLLVVSRDIPPFALHEAPVALGGLSAADSRLLLASRGVTLPAALADELHARSGGNVQLLILAIDALSQTGQPAALIARLAQADNIERYLLHEVDRRLAAGERELLRAAAAMLGYSATAQDLAAVLGSGSLRAALHSLARRHLLIVGGDPVAREYGTHAIVRAFYYADLAPDRRRELHLRAAQHYAAAGGDPLRAARHYAAAGAHAQAAALALADPWRAINSGRAGELDRLLGEVVAPALAPEMQLELAITRGELHALLRRDQEAEEEYAQALALVAAQPPGPALREQRARICRGMGDLLELSDPAAALEWLERGQAEVAGSGSAEEAAIELRIGSVLIGLGEYEPARAALERSLTMLATDREQLRATALLNLGTVYAAQGAGAASLALYRQALELYQRAHNAWAMIGAWHNIATEMEIGGDWVGAEEQYWRALDLAERLGNQTRQAHIALSLGILTTNRGDFGAALGHLTRGRELSTALRLRELEVAYASSLADLWLRQGAGAQAEPLLAAAEELARSLGSKYQLPEIYRGLAQLWRERDPQRALAYARQAVDLAEELGDLIGVGASLRLLGELLGAEQAATAESAFARSLELLAGQDPYEAARTEAQWGRLLLGSGATERGRALIATAQATFARLGAAYDREQLAGAVHSG